ncbi:MAG TPA: cyclase family protein [Candidatus Limnocylindrales bacterium]|jgi:kynurenine formamidase
MSNADPQTQSNVVRRRVVESRELGAVSRLTALHTKRALGLVQAGRVYDLGLERFKGMPLPPMHPPMEVIGYRSPRGLRTQGDQDWINSESNEARLAFNSELVIMCLHTGTHLDSLAHITLGDDAHWFGGFTADKDLGDFGPLKSDTSTMAPIVTRGVMLDVAKARGVDALDAHEAITAGELELTAKLQGTPIEDGDVVLVRTGYLASWPDRVQLARHEGAGIDLSAAHWLAERGCVLVGSDTETVEQVPPAMPGNPHPVHSFLLVEKGILLLELADLEGLAKDGIHEFAFICLPVKIRGGTGALVDPIAIA